MLRKKRTLKRLSMRKFLNRNHAIYDTQGSINMNTKDGFTNEKMYDPMIIAKGSKGDNVTKLQNDLNKLADMYKSIPKVEVDGIFGPKTEEAVLQFQGMFNLTTDGVVGRYTWTALNDALTGKINPDETMT